MVKPIRPSEVAKNKINVIPDPVIKAFNEIITLNYNDGISHFKLKEVVKLILTKNPRIKESDLFDNNWLDVEDMYRRAGWQVEYDNPAYNESYDANFTFTRKR